MATYLLMPISKEAFQNPENSKKAIDFLVDSGLAFHDMKIEVWSYPFRVEGQYYGEEELKYDSLLDLYKDIKQIKMDETMFKVGFSQYSMDYDRYKEQGKLPGINFLTEQLQSHISAFSKENEISPILDIFGHIKIGFISEDGQDEQGEIRGVGIYCDGYAAYFMEEAGYLNTLDSSLGIYQVLENLAQIYGEKMTLQFRS